MSKKQKKRQKIVTSVIAGFLALMIIVPMVIQIITGVVMI